MDCSVSQEGSFLKAAKRPAHGVRNNRSPMQAPERARSIGEGRSPDFAPVRAQQKLAVTYPLGEHSVLEKKRFIPKGEGEALFCARRASH